MNYQLFQYIHGLAGHNLALDAIMVFLTQRAILIYAIILLIMWFGNHKKVALYAGITGLFALLINYGITLIYFEPRPFVAHHVHVLIKHAADASFPSDHTTGAFALSIAVLLRKNGWGYFMLILAVLTGISRIWVGHHYPFDVIGSILVGSLASLLVYRFSFLVEPFVGFVIRLYERFIFVLRRRVASGK